MTSKTEVETSKNCNGKHKWKWEETKIKKQTFSGRTLHKHMMETCLNINKHHTLFKLNWIQPDHDESCIEYNKNFDKLQHIYNEQNA